MKLVEFRHRSDYGHDYYINILKMGRWYLFQSCFSVSEYGRGFPYFNITMGGGRLIYIAFDVLKVGFCVEFICRSWFKDT